MAKVFLDTNYFIDTIHRRPEKDILNSLIGHTVYISPLSLHIYCYIYKIKIPDSKVLAQIENFQIIDISQDIAIKALNGPTTDFEDNIQLHSCAETDCSYFLTEDKKLLNLKFFGKTRILPSLLDKK